MRAKVFIVDDHPMVVAGLHSLLNQLENLEVAGSVSNAFEAIPFLKKHKVDVILLDINLPDISGIDLCKKNPCGVSGRQNNWNQHFQRPQLYFAHD